MSLRVFRVRALTFLPVVIALGFALAPGIASGAEPPAGAAETSGTRRTAKHKASVTRLNRRRDRDQRTTWIHIQQPYDDP
jgi:hypothetical protein